MRININKWSRVLAGIGGAILLITAVFHGTGLLSVKSVLAQSSIDPEWASVLSGLWVFVSWHWLVIAAPSVWFAIRNSGNGRSMLFFCGIVAFGDFWWVLTLAGFFAGTALLLLASLCLLAGGWMANRKRAENKT